MRIVLVNESASRPDNAKQTEVLVQVAHVMSSACPKADFGMLQKLLRKSRTLYRQKGDQQEEKRIFI
jgi:hypothetical protein